MWHVCGKIETDNWEDMDSATVDFTSYKPTIIEAIQEAETNGVYAIDRVYKSTSTIPDIDFPDVEFHEE